MADEFVLCRSQEWQEALADGALLRSVLDGSQDPTWISHQGRIRYLNDAALDLFQHSRDEMFGKRADGPWRRLRPEGWPSWWAG